MHLFTDDALKTRGINNQTLRLGCCLPPHHNFWLRVYQRENFSQIRQASNWLKDIRNETKNVAIAAKLFKLYFTICRKLNTPLQSWLQHQNQSTNRSFLPIHLTEQSVVNHFQRNDVTFIAQLFGLVSQLKNLLFRLEEVLRMHVGWKMLRTKTRQ